MTNKILLAAALMIAAAQCAFCSSILDPSAVGVGARPLGMGKAYIGIADDPSSIFLNPAGLGDVKTINMTSMRATLAGDINYTVLGTVLPSDRGNFAIGLVNSSITGIPLTRWVTTGGVTRPETYAYTDYGASVFLLSYGTHVKKNISLGASLKYFSQYFSEGSASMEGASGTGIDLDLGVKMQPSDWMRLGVTLANILPASMGGKFTWKKNNVQEEIPASLKIGTAFDIVGPNGLRKAGSQEVVWAIDAEKSLDVTGNPMVLHSGIEWRPVKYFSFRFGLDQQASAQGASMGVETNLTYGVGIKIAPVSFDYAYHQYGDLSENTTHYFSVTLFQDPEKKKI